jgi:hypothetical protein
LSLAGLAAGLTTLATRTAALALALAHTALALALAHTALALSLARAALTLTLPTLALATLALATLTLATLALLPALLTSKTTLLTRPIRLLIGHLKFSSDSCVPSPRRKETYSGGIRSRR